MRKSLGGLLAFMLLLVLALGGCSAGSTPPSSAAGDPSPSSSVGGARGGPATDPGALPTPIDVPTLQQAAPPQSSGDPALSTQAVEQYIGYIVGSADTYWTAWLKNGYGLQEPFVYYEVVQPSETYQTTCQVPGGGVPDPTTHDFPNAYYCGVDVVTTADGNQYTGVLVLPATTFQKMWNGDILGTPSRTAGDFAAAYIIAHEFGHHIADEFTTQSKKASEVTPETSRAMPPITGANNELLADCFAGAWISYAYSQGVLTDTDYDEALRAAEAVGDKPGTISQDPHGTPEERMYAVRVGAEYGANGFPAGHPSACTSTYWK